MRSSGAAIVLLTLATGLAAQQPPAPCETPAHRQFDFWIGDWQVADSTGVVLGHNRIDLVMNGCVLHEHWTGARGTTGESFNIYRTDTRTWHQTWVDSSGSLLLLEGTLEDGAMVLRGETGGQAGTRLQRITYRPLEGGGMLQLWEASADGGATWTVAFRGIYKRVAG